MTDQPSQLTRAALAKMTPAEIVQARRAGRLDAIQRGEDGNVDHHAEPVEQLTRADLAGMTSAQIQQARRDGRLDDLLDDVAGGDYE